MVKIMNTVSCVFVVIIQWKNKPQGTGTQCVQHANTLFAFVFTAASTSSAVHLLPLSCDFFNQLSIDWNLTSGSSMVVIPPLNYIYYAPTTLLNCRYYSQACSQNSAM